jgi:Transglutaminase-like superfamily
MISGVAGAFLFAAALLSMASGASRRYEIDWRDQRVGRADLTVTRSAAGIHYAWRASIGVASPNCLRVEESRAGDWKEGASAPMPEELFLALRLPDGCRAVSSDTSAAGEGCLVHRAPREIEGTLLGQPFKARLGADGLPDEVELSTLAISYRKSSGAADVPCPEPLEAAQRLLGGEAVADARRINHSEFSVGGHSFASRRASGLLPKTVADLLARSFEQSTGRDCKEVAREVTRKARKLGLQARTVGGLLWDRGQLWPHAWNEILLPQAGWVAVDATTGSSFADAGRLTVGSLEPPEALSTGLKLLALSSEPVRVISYDP